MSRFIAVFIILAMALTACGTTPVPDPEPGEEVINGSLNDHELSISAVTSEPETEFTPSEDSLSKEEEKEEEIFKYRIDDETATITKYNGEESVVSIPSTIDGYPVTAIGSFAFYNSKVIESVTIPEGVTIIDNDAFGDCKLLKSIILPSTLEVIGDNAFSGCTLLVDIVLPDSLAEMGRGSFFGCTSLVDIVLPDSLTDVGSYAFLGCTSLKSINIPKAAKMELERRRERDGFSGYESLERIDVAPENPYYTSIDGVLFNKDLTILLFYPDRRVESTFIIPDSVIEIHRYAFNNYEELEIVYKDIVFTGEDIKQLNTLYPINNPTPEITQYWEEHGEWDVSELLLMYVYNSMSGGGSTVVNLDGTVKKDDIPAFEKISKVPNEIIETARTLNPLVVAFSTADEWIGGSVVDIYVVVGYGESRNSIRIGTYQGFDWSTSTSFGEAEELNSLVREYFSAEDLDNWRNRTLGNW